MTYLSAAATPEERSALFRKWTHALIDGEVVDGSDGPELLVRMRTDDFTSISELLMDGLVRPFVYKYHGYGTVDIKVIMASCREDADLILEEQFGLDANDYARPLAGCVIDPFRDRRNTCVLDFEIDYEF